MNDYKGWTGAQRIECEKRLLEAINKGEIKDSSEYPCEICGDTRKRHHYHCTNYDYDKAMDSLHPLCWCCHINLHSIENGESSSHFKAAVSYFNNVKKRLGCKKMPMPIPQPGKEWLSEDEASE